MFVALFVVSFLLALAVAACVAWLSKEPIEGILHRFTDGHLSSALSKYLRFAMVLVGISAGTRVRALQDYMAAPSWNKAEITATLTPEFWVMELYRTVVSTLEGILWLLLVVAFIALVVFKFIRKDKLNQPQTAQEQPKTSVSQSYAKAAKG